MRLRIVAGSLGRRFITVDKNARMSEFRPTQERVRQAVAETIKTGIPGAVVVDLCAGSGAFGFEMASRGAERVHFVESDRARAQCIAKHIELFGVKDICTVIQADVRKFVPACRQQYDIVFYDPPYGDAGLAALAGQLPSLLSKNGVLLYERDVSEVPSSDIFPSADFNRETREYGDTAVEFIRRKARKPGIVG
jgi:16S rRNA (guanine966-N2)-methyltransferase